MKQLFSRLRQRLTPPEAVRWGLFPLACLLTGLQLALAVWLVEGQSAATPALWYTALFLGALTALFGFLAHSLLAGGLVVVLPVMILTFVDYFKVAITATPLTFAELALAGQVGDIAALNAGALKLSPAGIGAILWMVLWLGVLFFFSQPLRLPWKHSAPAALIPAALLMGVFWLGLDGAVLAPLGAPLELRLMSQSEANARCGFPLGFWRAARLASLQTDTAVDPELLEELIDKDLQSTQTASPTATPRPTPSPAPTPSPTPIPAAVPSPSAAPSEAPDPTPAPTVQPTPAPTEEPWGDKPPNIVLFLGESFFDVTTLPGVTFDSDPLEEFHALQAEGVSGSFMTRTLGYGTCNIELEVLTGVNTFFLNNENLYSIDPDRLGSLPTVPALLKQAGYKTVMLHTFNDSIYHRAPIMKAIGFQRRYFSGDVAAIDPEAAAADNLRSYLRANHLSGTYYSDDYLVDLIGYVDGQTGSQPLFTYAISVENHSPHSAAKYSGHYTVKTTSPLTGKAKGALASAVQGVNNTSEALGKLTDYFRERSEPTVVIFFGDHRPGLGLGDGIASAYSALGMCDSNQSWTWSEEEAQTLHTTSYLIWSNDPAYLPAPAGTTATNSSNYLGLAVLEAARVEKPLYWRLLEQMSEFRLIDTLEYRMDRAGNFYSASSDGGVGEEEQALLDRFSLYLNDAVYGEQTVTADLWK